MSASALADAAASSSSSDLAVAADAVQHRVCDARRLLEEAVALLGQTAPSRGAVRGVHADIVLVHGLLNTARVDLVSLKVNATGPLPQCVNAASLAVDAGVEKWKEAKALYTKCCAAMPVRLRVRGFRELAPRSLSPRSPTLFDPSPCSSATYRLPKAAAAMPCTLRARRVNPSCPSWRPMWSRRLASRLGLLTSSSRPSQRRRRNLCVGRSATQPLAHVSQRRVF